MIKVSFFGAQDEYGQHVFPLFTKSDSVFEKVAAPTLLPEVLRYVETLRPSRESQYVLLNAMAASEYFGCFPAGTMVQSLFEELPIEKIEPGTMVLTHRNRWRHVLSHTMRHTEELCDLYVQGLPSTSPVLTATPNHELWAVLRDDFLSSKKQHIWLADTMEPVEERRKLAMQELSFTWCPIADLCSGDMVAEPFPLQEDPAALGDEKWNTPEVAFLMGLYAAEGCVAYRDDEEAASIVYVISGEEMATRDRAIAGAAVLGHKLGVLPSKSGTSVRLQLCFKELTQLCLEHIGSPAEKKRLSGQILRMPHSWQETFFRAYADGDGCVRGAGKEEGTVRCVSASAGLLRDMRLLLARLGLVASISGRHNKRATWYSGNPIFELSVSGGRLKGYGSPKSYLHPSGCILSSVKRVERYEWSGEVHDLTVEEDASFVASGVSVHNSNVNGDAFTEESLIHKPNNWANDPVIDSGLAKSWPYGFPCFYNAKAYAHHRNKQPERAFGEVELAAWHPSMKRVELVVRVDYDRCLKFGGMGAWDKLKAGSFPDVSMGTKVPFDACSVCLDWDLYRKAQATFDSRLHKHPGEAVLQFHKKLKAQNGVGIRGLAITRVDYCVHAKTMMNKILPDGRKVFVYNDYPRFFDISFVFIGADKTAKVMVKIAEDSRRALWSLPSAELAEKLGYSELPDDDAQMDKAASVDDLFKEAFLGKSAKLKGAEITKDVIPSQLSGMAVPLLNAQEQDLPTPVLNRLGHMPLEQVFGSLAALGMLLRPREFQRILLSGLGQIEEADRLDQHNQVFSRSGEQSIFPPRPLSVDPAITQILAPFMQDRSALGPCIERRITVIVIKPETEKSKAASHNSDLLRKIGSAYNGYRKSAMNFLPEAVSKMGSAGMPAELVKMASSPLEQIIRPLSFSYFQDAFWEETGKTAQASGQRGEG